MDANKRKLQLFIGNFFKKMNTSDRVVASGKIWGQMLSSITKRLARTEGYSVANNILSREIREIGRQDAGRIIKEFDLKEKDVESAKTALMIAASQLGLELDIVNDKTVARGCPVGRIAKELNEPFLVNICHEYCKGVVEKIMGEKFTVDK